MKGYSQLLANVSAIGLAVMAANPAAAQEAAAPAPAAGGMEDIVVTARYRAENVQSTPIAITAVSGDALAARNITNVQDLGAVVPNALITPGAAAVGPTPAMSMRGVFQSDFNFAFEPGVGTYVDNVYQSTLMGSALDLMDLERVEVLRGPQGTLFGKNSMGGAIRLFSKRPEGSNTGYIEASYGRFNRLDFKGAFDFALIPDRLFARVSGVSKRVEGYQTALDFTCQMIKSGTPELAGIGDGRGAGGGAVAVGSAADNAASFPQSTGVGNSCKTGAFGKQNLNAARIMLRYVASDALEFNLSGEYTADDKNSGPDSLIAVTNPALSSTAVNDGFFSIVRDGFLNAYGFTYDDRFVTGNPYTNYSTHRDLLTGRVNPNTSSVHSWAVSGTTDYDISDNAHAKLIVAYRAYNSQFSHDADMSPLAVSNNYNDIKNHQFSAELQVNGQAFNDKLDWTLGGFYFDADTHLGGFIDYVLLHFQQNDGIHDLNKSAFVHGVYHLTDKLSVTGGVRYSDNSKTFDFDHPGGGVAAISATASLSRLDWKLGVDYKLNDDFLVYGVAATGFRPKGINPRPLTPNQLVPTPGEDIVTYELGFKGDFFDRRLRLNLSGFYSDYKQHLSQVNGFECVGRPGVVAPVFDPNICIAGGFPAVLWFAYVADKARVQGIEAELTAEPIDGLTLNGSLGWIDFKSKVKDTTAPNYRDPSNLVQPKLNLSAGAQYAIPLPGGSHLTPRLDWSYQSKMTYNPAFSFPASALTTVPAHSVFNGRISYETADKDWVFTLSGTNLFNKFYYYNKFSLTGFNVSGTPSRPREWMVTVRKNF